MAFFLMQTSDGTPQRGSPSIRLSLLLHITVMMYIVLEKGQVIGDNGVQFNLRMLSIFVLSQKFGQWIP